MKRFACVLVLVGLCAVPASAAPILGSVTFGGAIGATNFLTTNLLDINNDTGIVLCAVINNCEGDYSSLSGLILADHNDIAIPTVAGELWAFSFGGLDYSFDLASIDSVVRGPSGIILTGSGTAYITGFEPTAAAWSFSANNTQQFVFSSTVATVPEPAIVGLVGLGLFGVVRRLRRAR